MSMIGQISQSVRQNILLNLNSDKICITETHLSFNQNCQLSGYVWEDFYKPCTRSILLGSDGMFVQNELQKTYKTEIPKTVII